MTIDIRRVFVILPTVRGREQVFDATYNAFAEQLGIDDEIIVVRDAPTVGEAWNAGVADIDDLVGADILVFATDDATPMPGAVHAAVDSAQRGMVPSPRLVAPDGTLEGCGSMGLGGFLPACPDKTPCRSSGVPACTADLWWRVGEFLPIHYYVDDEWCWRAMGELAECEARTAYAFTHHHANPRRVEMQARAMMDRQAFLRSAAGLDPFS